MKLDGLIILTILGCAISTFAAEHGAVAVSSSATHFSIGYGVRKFHDDFGVGLTVTSPYFAKKKVAIQLSGAGAWLEGVQENRSKATWMPYGNIGLDIIGVGAHISGCMRLYGKGGVVLIVPNSKFSSSAFTFGGAGAFGFEFIPKAEKHLVTYYIELGGIGTGARAEKLHDKPLHSNGFLVSVGLKYYLKPSKES
jgi:hypothetical protein